MTDSSGIDWEDAFINGDYIPDGRHYPDKWNALAAATRASSEATLDIAYGSHARETLDLFYPASVPKGLVVFIHGGYWHKFDKSSWSHLAAGPLAHGWAVAIPGYVLAPEASIAGMTQQIANAISVAAQQVDGPIRLSGHSAGGHLATRMVCTDAPLVTELTHRIERVVSISGLHDLRPLMLHSMNQTLGLDAAMASLESPALLEPLQNMDVIAWVGADERPEFLRQSSLLTEIWRQRGARTRLVAEQHRHHFNIIEGLAEAQHPLCEALVGEQTQQ